MDKNILDDELRPDAPEIHLAEASKGKRFANYLIDSLITNGLGLLATVIGYTFIGYEFGYDNHFGFDYILPIFVAVVYYVGFEFNGGRTVGKYVTNTRAVTQDGYSPSLNRVIGRSFARLIPFEAFSFLGESLSGWHDTLSKTLVVDLGESKLPHDTETNEDYL